MSGGVKPTAGKSTRDAVLVVNDREGIADRLRLRYPTWEVSVSQTYLSAISELSRRRVRAVVAFVDPSQEGLEQAVAGLRDAAGDSTKLLLCCRAEAESMTLRAMQAGANDYLLYPLRDEELDAALVDQVRDSSEPGTVSAPVDSSLAELKALGEVVSRLGAPPEEILAPLAELLRTAMGVVGARVVVEGSVGKAGENVSDPEMVEALYRESKSIGHVAIGSRLSGDYTPSDVEKLRQYAILIGHVVSAALDRHRLHKLAFTDELSGLPNRRYLLEFLERRLERALEDHSSVTLLMFDIDNFKSYNDAYGHDAGDEIIRGCGELFRSSVRDHDVVTRYGGDEFAVIFWDKGKPRIEGSQHPPNVLPLIERFRRCLRGHQFERFNLPENARLTISGGLASFPKDASTGETLITRADEALLLAKREGKNCIYLGGEHGGPALGADPA